MLYEMRTYEPADGAAEQMKERFEKHALPLLERHGIHVIGCFEPEEDRSRLVYVACFPDEERRKQAWADFSQDPEWQRIKAATEQNGALLARQSALVLHPTDFSPKLR